MSDRRLTPRTSRREEAAIKALSTETLRTIVTSLGANEVREQSPEFPLGGIVHITGIGQVRAARLRDELASREAS
jgi:hypothetical protein